VQNEIMARLHLRQLQHKAAWARVVKRKNCRKLFSATKINKRNTITTTATITMPNQNHTMTYISEINMFDFLPNMQKNLLLDGN